MAVSDFDGDGFQDLILTAPQGYKTSHGYGKVYILYGSQQPFAAKIALKELDPDNKAPLIQHPGNPGSNIINVDFSEE